jgi:hypothetical protein
MRFPPQFAHESRSLNPHSATRSHLRHFAPFAIILLGCGSALPEPELGVHSRAAFVEIPFPPPPARAEAVPDEPSSDDVWIDGEWIWRNNRWAWKNGYWIVPPEGATFAPSTLFRKSDSTLFLAQGAWHDESGKEIEPTLRSGASAHAREGTLINSEGELEDPAPNVKQR